MTSSYHVTERKSRCHDTCHSPTRLIYIAVIPHHTSSTTTRLIRYHRCHQWCYDNHIITSLRGLFPLPNRVTHHHIYKSVARQRWSTHPVRKHSGGRRQGQRRRNGLRPERDGRRPDRRDHRSRLEHYQPVHHYVRGKCSFHHPSSGQISR